MGPLAVKLEKAIKIFNFFENSTLDNPQIPGDSSKRGHFSVVTLDQIKRLLAATWIKIKMLLTPSSNIKQKKIF